MISFAEAIRTVRVEIGRLLLLLDTERDRVVRRLAASSISREWDSHGPWIDHRKAAAVPAGSVGVRGLPMRNQADCSPFGRLTTF